MSQSRLILVLAATGTTGRETVRALTERGARVRAATRDPQRAEFPEGVDAVRFSFTDADTWAAALDGVDAVYLATPSFHPLELSRALVTAAAAAGVQRIVRLGAMGAEQMPEGVHRQIELAIEASGVAWVHLRPNFFMDNFITFHGETISRDSAFCLPAADGASSFVAARDIGDMAATALLGDMTSEAWTLTGPEALNHTQVAEQLSEALKRPVRYVDITPEAHAQGMRDAGMPEEAVAVMSGLYDVVRQGWTSPVSNDIERVLGRAPLDFQMWAFETLG